MNLENSIKDVIAKKLEDGTVERVIAEELEKGIRKSLEELFGWRGDASKVIKEKIKSVMVPYLESYDYSRYITKLDSILIEVLKNTALDNKKMLENFKDLMSYEPIKKITVSEIFDKWRDSVGKKIDTSDLEVEFDDGPRYVGPEVTLEVEYESKRDWSIYENATIFLECEKDENLNVEIKLQQYKEYGWEIRFNQICDINSLRHSDTFAIFLMQLAQSGTKVIIDEDYIEDEVEVDAEPEPSWS